MGLPDAKVTAKRAIGVCRIQSELVRRARGGISTGPKIITCYGLRETGGNKRENSLSDWPHEM